MWTLMPSVRKLRCQSAVSSYLWNPHQRTDLMFCDYLKCDAINSQSQYKQLHLCPHLICGKVPGYTMSTWWIPLLFYSKASGGLGGRGGWWWWHLGGGWEVQECYWCSTGSLQWFGFANSPSAGKIVEKKKKNQTSVVWSDLVSVWRVTVSVLCGNRSDQISYK